MDKDNASNYCQNKALAKGSSFYYSFLFLPAAQKEAIIAVYAFCREVDDIVDECSDKEIARAKLGWWALELDRVFNGNPEHPVGIALTSVVKKYALQKVWFEEILQGMQMDLQYQGYETDADLTLYCHCVASTVGMLAASIFGFTNPKTLEYAKQLGLAFQTINIIRDIGEDARRGRIYIPEETLTKYNISSTEILNLSIQNPANFTTMLQEQTEKAYAYYSKALDCLPNEDRAKQRSGLIMAKIYFCILEEIKRTNFAVMQQRISITPIRKLWLAWRGVRQEKKLCLGL